MPPPRSGPGPAPDLARRRRLARTAGPDPGPRSRTWPRLPGGDARPRMPGRVWLAPEAGFWPMTPELGPGPDAGTAAGPARDDGPRRLGPGLASRRPGPAVPGAGNRNSGLASRPVRVRLQARAPVWARSGSRPGPGRWPQARPGSGPEAARPVSTPVPKRPPMAGRGHRRPSVLAPRPRRRSPMADPAAGSGRRIPPPGPGARP